MVSFGSDNHSGVHPEVMAALHAANEGHVSAYGDDPWTREAEDLLRQEFGADSVPILVANGTGANLIALQSCLRPWDAVVCSDVAHINVDEGARLSGSWGRSSSVCRPRTGASCPSSWPRPANASVMSTPCNPRCCP